MGELDADRGLLALHEGDEGLEALHLRIVPDAEVMLIDQADLFDGSCLDKDQPEAAQRIAAEMHVVKGAAGVAGSGAVVDHRRHHQAVLQGQATDFERLEQQWARGVGAIGGKGWHEGAYCVRDITYVRHRIVSLFRVTGPAGRLRRHI